MDKICTACKQSKALDQFGKNHIFKDGLSIYCKDCRSAKAKTFRSTLSKEKKELYYKTRLEKLGREGIREYQRLHYRKHNPQKGFRYSSNIQKKIAHSLRTRIGQAVRGYRKTAHTWELIGCTPDELCKHLASKFTEGMSWDNYGQWHVDHIRPCAGFDLGVPEQQQACCHYTNLQPLWAVDNIRKSSKFSPTATL